MTHNIKPYGAVYRALKMTRRLIASSLAAAFAFGTAVGLYLSDNISDQRNLRSADGGGPDTPSGAPARSQPESVPPQPETNGSLVCKEVDGNTLCWPRESAPDQDDETYCYHNENGSNCLVKPVVPRPKLDI